MAAKFVSVAIKAGHPTGEYRRSGFVFTRAAPVVMAASDVTPAMEADAWLVITPESEDVTDALEGLNSMTRAELDAHAEALGIITADAKNKAEAIDRIWQATQAQKVASGSPEERAALIEERDALREELEEAKAENARLTSELAALTTSDAGAPTSSKGEPQD